jgi:hypothetical protein
VSPRLPLLSIRPEVCALAAFAVLAFALAPLAAPAGLTMPTPSSAEEKRLLPFILVEEWRSNG